jgi:hypothetical protein
MFKPLIYDKLIIRLVFAFMKQHHYSMNVVPGRRAPMTDSPNTCPVSGYRLFSIESVPPIFKAPSFGYWQTRDRAGPKSSPVGREE